MKKKLIGLVATITILSTVSITTLAGNENVGNFLNNGNSNSKVEELASLTNESEENLILEKQSKDLTYGELSVNYGVDEKFREFNLQSNIDRVNSLVSEGLLTQDEANEIIAEMDENSETCTGDGYTGNGVLNQLLQEKGITASNNQKNTNRTSQGTTKRAGNQTQERDCISE